MNPYTLLKYNSWSSLLYIHNIRFFAIRVNSHIPSFYRDYASGAKVYKPNNPFEFQLLLSSYLENHWHNVESAYKNYKEAIQLKNLVDLAIKENRLVTEKEIKALQVLKALKQ